MLTTLHLPLFSPLVRAAPQDGTAAGQQLSGRTPIYLHAIAGRLRTKIAATVRE
jgi:hypothetical protein